MAEAKTEKKKEWKGKAVHELDKQTTAVRVLNENFKDVFGEDADLKLDVIEGETGFNEAIDALLHQIREYEILIDGIAPVKQALEARKKRLETSVGQLKSIIKGAMQAAELDKLPLPTATLSVTKVAPKPVVEDESKVPSKFWKQPDPVLDKKALNAAFKELGEGETIAGVTSSGETSTLQIRKA